MNNSLTERLRFSCQFPDFIFIKAEQEIGSRLFIEMGFLILLERLFSVGHLGSAREYRWKPDS
jgi:hypothetical protein